MRTKRRQPSRRQSRRRRAPSNQMMYKQSKQVDTTSQSTKYTLHFLVDGIQIFRDFRPVSFGVQIAPRPATPAIASEPPASFVQIRLYGPAFTDSDSTTNKLPLALSSVNPTNLKLMAFDSTFKRPTNRDHMQDSGIEILFDKNPPFLMSLLVTTKILILPADQDPVITTFSINGITQNNDSTQDDKPPPEPMEYITQTDRYEQRARSPGRTLAMPSSLTRPYRTRTQTRDPSPSMRE